MPVRIVVGISGATGVIYGIRIMEILKELEVETHLIISDAGKKNIELETGYEVARVEALATEVHDICNVGASISSGSFKTHGMIVAPCSIKSLSAIANSFNNNLLIRSADVTLKEKRKLVMIVRETPLHVGHLRLMTMVAEAGGVLLPPMPAFYNPPETLEDMIDQTAGKALDQFGIEHNLFNRWYGTDSARRRNKEALKRGLL